MDVNCFYCIFEPIYCMFLLLTNYIIKKDDIKDKT